MIDPPTADYLDQLTHPHKAHLRVTAMEPDGTVLGTLPVASVHLTLDGQSTIRRSATIVVGQDYLYSESRPVLEASTVDKTLLKIEHAIDLMGTKTTQDFVTIATLRVQDVERDKLSAGVEMVAFDRTLLLDEFKTPTAQPLDLTYINLIKRLIAELEAPASAPVPPPPTVLQPFHIDPSIDQSKSPAAGKSLAPGTNRLEEIQRFSEAIGGVFSCNEFGEYTLAPYKTLPDPPITVRIGEGGTLAGVTQAFSRQNQYNAVGLEFSPEDPSGPVIKKFFYLYENDPASPIYYDGPFGRRNIFFIEDYDHIPDDATALAIAEERLAQYSGALQGLDISMVYNPLLQPGDQIEVILPDAEPELHIVDFIELDLGTSARMHIRTRLAALVGGSFVSVVM